MNRITNHLRNVQELSSRGAYARWLIYQVFGEGRTTFWLAEEIGADRDQVLWDFEHVLNVEGGQDAADSTE